MSLANIGLPIACSLGIKPGVPIIMELVGNKKLRLFFLTKIQEIILFLILQNITNVLTFSS
jgi:hypothetical protein